MRRERLGSNQRRNLDHELLRLVVGRQPVDIDPGMNRDSNFHRRATNVILHSVR